jgi:hypothetical protein
MRSNHGHTWRVSTTKQQHAPGAAGAARDPYRRPVAADVLHTAIDRVMGPTLLSHASGQTTASYAWRGDRTNRASRDGAATASLRKREDVSSVRR